MHNPQWIAVGGDRKILSPKEKALARKLDVDDLRAWQDAIWRAFKHSRPERRQFMVIWRADVSDAILVSSGEPRRKPYYVPVWA